MTTLFLAARRGDAEALDLLVPRIYEELKVAARQQLARNRRGDTLNTTALVHEAYVRLVDGEHVPFSDKAHFLALAARTMRFVLIDHARAQSADKRGGAVRHERLDSVQIGVDDRVGDLVQVDQALQRLESFDERLGRVVECRFFGGLTYEEMADVFGCSVPTVKRDWRRARIWLHDFLQPA